jgi:hypothetical protein
MDYFNDTLPLSSDRRFVYGRESSPAATRPHAVRSLLPTLSRSLRGGCSADAVPRWGGVSAVSLFGVTLRSCYSWGPRPSPRYFARLQRFYFRKQCKIFVAADDNGAKACMINTKTLSQLCLYSFNILWKGATWKICKYGVEIISSSWRIDQVHKINYTVHGIQKFRIQLTFNLSWNEQLTSGPKDNLWLCTFKKYLFNVLNAFRSFNGLLIRLRALGLPHTFYVDVGL